MSAGSVECVQLLQWFSVTICEVFILVICLQKSGDSCQKFEEKKKIMGEFTFEKIPFIDLIISGNSEKTTMILYPRKCLGQPWKC